MQWTIEWMTIIILTSLTGSIFLGIWVFIGWALERMGYLDIMYDILQMAVFFFIFPVTYLILKHVCDPNELGKGTMFLQTKQILTFSSWFCLIWLVGVGIMSVAGTCAFLSLRKRYQANAGCNEKTKELFRKVCEEMHIPEGKVRLSQTYKVNLSELTGALYPVVVIPDESEAYTEEELRIMFVHELNHYRQKDIWIRYFMLFALMINFFNPIVWVLSLLLHKYGEYACDSKSCRDVGSRKIYCKILFQLSDGQQKKRPYFSARLAENGQKLTRRIRRMERNRRYKRRSPGVAAALCAGMLFGNAAMVYAASNSMIDIYASWYDHTVVQEEETPQVFKELKEYTDFGPSDDLIEIEAEVEENQFPQTVKPGHVYKTPEFPASSGGSIHLSAYIDPRDKMVSIGIIEPDGTKRYLNQTDSLHHKFSLNQTGDYRIFVENHNAVEVDVDAGWLVGK